jgi:hypothetical protein
MRKRSIDRYSFKGFRSQRNNHLNHTRISLLTLLLAGLLIASGAAPGLSAPRVGENDIRLTGPAIAPVDSRYATVQAARRTLLGHAHLPIDPILYGEWTVLNAGSTVRAIHVTVLRTGKVLLLAGSGNDATNLASGTFTGQLWDPATNTIRNVPPPWDMFCAGHLVEPDGNVLIMGGTISYPVNGNGVWRGSNRAYRFNVVAERWEALSSMSRGRWYPTAVQDPTGNDILVYSGRDETGAAVRVPEAYNRDTRRWRNLPAMTFPLYPGLLWTAKGQLFFSGAATGTTNLSAGLLSPYTGAYNPIAGGIDMTTRNGAATVFAGAAQDQLAWLVGGGFPATNTTVLTDLRADNPVSSGAPDSQGVCLGGQPT